MDVGFQGRFVSGWVAFHGSHLGQRSRRCQFHSTINLEDNMVIFLLKGVLTFPLLAGWRPGSAALPLSPVCSDDLKPISLAGIYYWAVIKFKGLL